MKKTLLSIITLTTMSFGCTAQNVNIPDANFKAYLVGNSAINTNADSEIQINEASTFSGTISSNYSNISDLTGIEAFTSITKLFCSHNSLNTIDISQNTALTELNLSYNNLTSLDVTQNTLLTILNCGSNPIGTIDVSQNTVLYTFYTNNNNLTSLDVTHNPVLINLVCPYNNLTSLDVSQNTNLYLLSCSNNSLTSLDISQNTSLEVLACSNNDLTSLNMKNISTATLTNFNATTNPNLTCIEVDDVTAATANWTNIDAGASFSLDCNYLSLNEYDIAKNITIYPNPVTSIIYINSDEVIDSIDIIDVFGKTIKSNLTSNNIIEVSNLSNGIYFLQVSTSKGLASKKFIKE